MYALVRRRLHGTQVHTSQTNFAPSRMTHQVSYKSKKHPWLVFGARFHNKVNMHHEWDMVKLDLPDYVFSPEQIAAKGQHYIVHFSSRSPTDRLYTDAIDVLVHPKPVDPKLIYGKYSGKWGWIKTDHCQFNKPKQVVSAIRNATGTIECRADMMDTEMSKTSTNFGINVVATPNPDVVPKIVSREVEQVDPVCTSQCTPTPEDDSVRTAGYCRHATAQANVAVCASPSPIHTVTWANPAVSKVYYDESTVSNVLPGDYIAFEWDDVVHDVYVVPGDTWVATGCNTSAPGFKKNAQQVIPPSHHATIDATTEDTVVEGRNRYRIPDSAAGKVLAFMCSLNGHCDAGQHIVVKVGTVPAPADPKRTEGVCQKGFTLCPDQSKQTETYAKVETKVNVPYLNTLATDSKDMKLKGKVTRAATPWDQFKFRKIVGKVCRSRPQNTRVSFRAPAVAGADWGNKPVWEFPDNSLREVLEACSSSHPDICTGISWKSGGDSNHTIMKPATPNSRRTYSSQRRNGGYLGGWPAWIPSTGSKGQWYQLDLGEVRDVTGAVLQARINHGPWAVTGFTVKYSSDNKVFTNLPGEYNAFPKDWSKNWAKNPNAMYKVFFPKVFKARYVRFTIQKFVGGPALRVEVLLHLRDNMFKGKHYFRRCMETSDFTRLVKVGSLSKAESLKFKVPSDYKKTVSCPHCYQCREAPLAPNTLKHMHDPGWGSYVRHTSNNGFLQTIQNRGKANATLTVTLLETIADDDKKWRLYWEHHNPEFICRITSTKPLEPVLKDDADWITFLPPRPSGSSLQDTVIDAMAAGFQPPEAVEDFRSRNQANLAAVFPPGEQLDPTKTKGPWHSREWRNKSAPSLHFTVPKQKLGGARGGYWPPKSMVKVTFMPVAKNEYRNRLYPRGYNYKGVLKLMEQSRKEGWHVDQGHDYGKQTNSVTGKADTFGWRCRPPMAWFGQNCKFML